MKLPWYAKLEKSKVTKDHGLFVTLRINKYWIKIQYFKVLYHVLCHKIFVLSFIYNTRSRIKSLFTNKPQDRINDAFIYIRGKKVPLYEYIATNSKPNNNENN